MKHNGTGTLFQLTVTIAFLAMMLFLSIVFWQNGVELLETAHAIAEENLWPFVAGVCITLVAMTIVNRFGGRDK